MDRARQAEAHRLTSDPASPLALGQGGHTREIQTLDCTERYAREI